MSSRQEIPQLGVIDRLIAGDDQYETALIRLLYELDAGVEYLDFLISETGPGYGEEWLEKPKARINELFDSVGLDSRNWINSRIEPVGQPNNRIKQISLSDRDSRFINLEGVNIGTFFTEVANNALPIESGGGDMDIEMSFDVSPKYILKLRASGSVEFIYPDIDEEDQESELEYSITFNADILHKQAI